jgi:hypothetical protein
VVNVFDSVLGNFNHFFKIVYSTHWLVALGPKVSTFSGHVEGFEIKSLAMKRLQNSDVQI